MNHTNTTSYRNAAVDGGSLINRLHWVVVFVAMPTLAIFGIAGNSLSIIVLYRQGFKKSTNILLFALAISDILFIIGVNGPARVMYEWGQEGFWFPETEAHVLYYIYHIFDYFNWTAGPMSMGMPVLITAERFVAVFFPLKFHTIVTRGRTLTAVFILILLTYLPQIYMRFWFRFDYVHDPIHNTSVGLSVRTSLFSDHEILTMLISHFYAANGYFVFIVGSGCIAICIRVSLAAAQRRRLMAGNGVNTGKRVSSTNTRRQHTQGNLRAPSRTTKTLLTLCIFYTISSSVRYPMLGVLPSI
ncbi:hypothetical protein RRG08_000969 [Elysia crispata]|uniref:G-protein coupled receptors family 1 profile domain-containing protein n=1 Tax=Elysia crispata TaxID=231223 RepID=A0AAE1DXM0_9GAST|nr:hypothetical protein RRG08_000969 [Elysia crispata]